MMNERILAQALLLTGALEEQQRAVLEAMCTAAELVLLTQLRDSLQPEDCEAEFITAASLLAVASWEEAGESGSMEEFKAGDLTVKRGSRVDASARCLRKQAKQIIGPFLKDCFCFTGV